MRRKYLLLTGGAFALSIIFIVSVLKVNWDLKSDESSYGTVDEYEDYRSYLNKVWVVKDDEDNSFYTPSFRLKEIENGHVKGIFSSQMAGEGGCWKCNLEGTVVKNVIEGSYRVSDVTGNIRIEFFNENEAQVYISYENTALIVERSYNLNVLTYENSQKYGEIMEEYNQVFPIELDNYGLVYVRTGVNNYGARTLPIAYLTDGERNVYQEFKVDGNILNGIKWSEITIADLNGDGLEDIQFGTTLTEGEEVIAFYNFLQCESGDFVYENAEFVEGI